MTTSEVALDWLAANPDKAEHTYTTDMDPESPFVVCMELLRSQFFTSLDVLLERLLFGTTTTDRRRGSSNVQLRTARSCS